MIIIAVVAVLLIGLFTLFWINRYAWMGLKPPVEQAPKITLHRVEESQTVIRHVIASANMPAGNSRGGLMIIKHRLAAPKALPKPIAKLN